MLKNIVIKKPIAQEWAMFECEPEDYDPSETYYTEEVYLPRIMKDLGIVPSVSEVRRNKPELCVELNHLDYLEIKWGKHMLYILVGM